MSKCINSYDLSDTLSIYECRDGWYLWDETRGRNLSMREASPIEAVAEALAFYQKRLKCTEYALKSLRGNVDVFVRGFVSEEGDISIGEIPWELPQ